MSLDLDIVDWSLEHDRAVIDVITVSAVNYRNLCKKNFPSDVMVIGNNWFYIAELNYLKGEDVPMGEIHI